MFEFDYRLILQCVRFRCKWARAVSKQCDETCYIYQHHRCQYDCTYYEHDHPSQHGNSPEYKCFCPIARISVSMDCWRSRIRPIQCLAHAAPNLSPMLAQYRISTFCKSNELLVPSNMCSGKFPDRSSLHYLESKLQSLCCRNISANAKHSLLFRLPSKPIR